jgi:hypothetical protein
MREQQERSDRGPFEETKSILGFLIFIVHAFATQHELLWRVPGWCGRRYFGYNALIGLIFAIPVAIWVWPPSYGAEWLVHAWWVPIILLVVHRLAPSPRNVRVHSYDVGVSWLTRLSWMQPDKAQTTGEFFGAALLAVGLLGFCDTLAFICVAGAALNLIHIALIEARYRRIAENSADNRLEGRMIADRIRDLERDR